jgi:2-polyprenyl-3-methyl-5-hydroxy-6-metoxy-1,4-benzoquinol methylase
VPSERPGPIRFAENDIRPDALRAAHAELVAADLTRMLRHKADFVSVACPACDDHAARPAFEKQGLRYVVCGSCETLFISPRPRPEHLREHYATAGSYTFWNTHIFPASEPVRREKIVQPRVRRLLEMCRRYGVNTGAQLEIGAGFGTFCEQLRGEGVFERVYAVEPTPDGAASCRRRGIDVIAKPIEDIAAGEIEPIDVVTAFECIEHVFAPREFLMHCRALLKPHGLLVLTCPNGHGFDVIVPGPASDTIDAEHLNYFNPASLSHLVGRCGFEVLEVTTPGVLDAELVRKKAMAGEIDLSAQPFLRLVLLDQWERLGAPLQDFLAANRLSGHMWLIARLRP